MRRKLTRRLAKLPPPPPPEERKHRDRALPVIPLFLASKNPGKVRELEGMLEGVPYHIKGPKMIKNLGSPVEDGATFEANARKKAIFYSRKVEGLVLADDSGLVIDAWDGQPGVRSARLGGPAASDADRVRLVLAKLEGVPWEERTARFQCVIAVAEGGVVLTTFEGQVEGLIAFEPKGAEGFGYDPVFFYPGEKKTFSEMSQAEKNRVSHRGQALERAVAWLKDWAEKHPPQPAT